MILDKLPNYVNEPTLTLTSSSVCSKLKQVIRLGSSLHQVNCGNQYIVQSETLLGHPEAPTWCSMILFHHILT